AADELPDVPVEGPVLALNREERARVGDRGLDLRAVADDARVVHEAPDSSRGVSADLLRIEPVERLPIRRALLENGRPAEPRLGGGPSALDSDADPGHGTARLFRVRLDQGDAAGRDARQERLAVRERVGLGPRRRIQDEAVSPRLTPGAPEDAAAGGSHRVDLHVAHLDPSSEVLSIYLATYHTWSRLGPSLPFS